MSVKLILGQKVQGQFAVHPSIDVMFFNNGFQIFWPHITFNLLCWATIDFRILNPLFSLNSKSQNQVYNVFRVQRIYYYKNSYSKPEFSDQLRKVVCSCISCSRVFHFLTKSKIEFLWEIQKYVLLLCHSVYEALEENT